MKKILILILLPFYLFAWQMEADKIIVSKTNTDVITHIDFRKPFSTTPLVFTLMDDLGDPSSSLRIINISTTGFDIYTVEPDGETGVHKRMIDIPYIAIEEGIHSFPNGEIIIAGKINTNNFQSKLISGSSYSSISINGTSNPVVLGQIQTRNNERSDKIVPGSPSRPWITTVINNVTSSSFNIALERSETTIGSLIQNEIVAYLAMNGNINSGDNYFASSNNKKIEFETIHTSTNIAGWDDGFTQFNFAKSYVDPIAAATKNSRNDADGGWLRRGSINSTNIQLTIDEDTSNDNERSHLGLEKASIIIFSEPFDVNFNAPSGSANLIINEIMYREENLGAKNDEFIELYTKTGGEIRGYILSDQDSFVYEFPSINLNSGDYVIVHSGSGTNTSLGNIHHFYADSSPIWDNDGEDVILLKPSNIDVTVLSDGKTVNAFPYDFVEYSGGNGDSIPVSMKNITLSWSSTYGGELGGAAKTESISLSPNGIDSNKAGCWEITASGNASNNSCSNYLQTVSTDPNGDRNSQGNSNTLNAEMSVLKTSIILSDGISASNPKRIPGSIIRYCFDVKNVGKANADNVILKDTMLNNLIYIKSGQIIQDISLNCNCYALTDSSGTISGQEVSVNIGTITGTSNTSTAKSCVYIEASIN